MDKPNFIDLIGKRFVNRGRSAVKGMDCWGLVMEVFRRYGVYVPDYTVDAFAFHTIDKVAGIAAQSRKWKRVEMPANGDAPLAVLMRMHPKYITHAGVYIGDNRIIHTMKCTDVIVSKATALNRRIEGYYRYVEDN